MREHSKNVLGYSTQELFQQHRLQQQNITKSVGQALTQQRLTTTDPTNAGYASVKS
jgi:hypothetical protein